MALLRSNIGVSESMPRLRMAEKTTFSMDHYLFGDFIQALAR
jgi:hypothetical protein